MLLRAIGPCGLMRANHEGIIKPLYYMSNFVRI